MSGSGNGFERSTRDVRAGNALDASKMELAISAMMDGTVDVDRMAEFLLALKEKGETVEELVGAARAMRSKMAKIHSTHSDLVDTCGTGGDGSGTFNISTAAAIVAAAAGIPVAKHGNRAISSRSGSADALKELGVNVDASVDTVEKCLAESGLCFCFAPLFHQSVRHVGQARKQLGVPTIFNMLGPLCNPAGAPFQIVGVGKPWQRALIAGALQMLGARRALVVHGRDGICEISNAGATDVSIVTPGGIRDEVWTPSDFGLESSTRSPLLADDPAASARIIKEILQGRSGAARDVVVINAAAAIWLVSPNQSLIECADLANKAIDSGQAAKKLGRLIELSRE